MRSLATFGVAAGLALSATGCIEFNDDCQALVSRPKDVIGMLAEEVLIDKPNARHAANAIGQLAADAYLHSQDSTARPAEFAVINGGNIRAEGVCVTRNILPPGPLKRGVLHEVLPFNNQVIAIDVTRDQLLKVLENSVANLSRESEAITDPSGNFLDIAGGVMEVDCNRPGGATCTVGSTCRVTRLVAGGRDVLAAAPSARFRLAITDFLVNFGDGVADVLRGLDSDPASNLARADGLDSDLTERYMSDKYSNVPIERGLKLDRERTKLLNCAVPARPAG